MNHCAASPLVNTHDFAVTPGFCGRGVGKAGIEAAEAEALRSGACTITLEVLTGTVPAKALYAASGFGDYQLDPAAGHAVFWQKRL